MKTLLFIAPIAVLFTACTKDDSYDNCKDNDKVSISALMAGLVPNSRTTDDGTNANWVTNDSIGLFCTQSNPVANNLKYTYSGSSWSTVTPIFWKDYTTLHQFYAYAPYAGGNTLTAVKIPVLNTQTGTINPTHNVLYSNNQRAGINRPANNGSVPLTFKHVLALIQLNIKIDGTVPANTTLTSVTINGQAGEGLTTSATGATFSLSDSTYTANGATNNLITVQPSSAPTLSTSTATTLNILVFPIATTTPTLTINCTFPNSTTGSASISLGSNLTFTRSTKYIYTVTLSRNAIVITNVTINPWLPGGSSTINPIL